MFLSFPAFSAGELSSLLDGRNDLAALKMGLRKGRNVIPQRVGPLLQRPGFMYRGLSLDQVQSDAARVKFLPFVADASAAYVLELSDRRMRFWKDGALVITLAGNDGQPGVISSVGTPLTIQTPYDFDILRELQWCHANDVMWIAHKDYPPYKLIRYVADGFYFELMTFLFPPLQDQNVAEITMAASGTLTVGGTVALVAAGGDVFDAGDIGGYYGIDHRRATPTAEISLSEGSAAATAVLSFSGNAVAAETLLTGTGANQRTYTWGAEGAYGVPVGGSVSASAASLVLAYNGGGQPGTIAHPSVEASEPVEFLTPVAATATYPNFGVNVNEGGQFVIGPAGATRRIYTARNTVNGSSPAFTVKRGANLAASYLNLAKAINASGVAGTDYGPGTTINPLVSANETIVGSSLVLTSLVAGAAGNGIPVLLSWFSTSTAGGASASTFQVKLTARIQGAGTTVSGLGNFIALAESMTNAAWSPTGFLTGGADNITADPSNPAAVIPAVRVSGQWEVYTLGRWYGLLTLQQQRGTGEWEVVRTWQSQNDGPNVQATGIVDGEKLMRLIFVGSGVADDDAPARAVLTATDAIVHGVVLITAVTDSTHATGTVVRDIWSTDVTYLWSGGSWSVRRGYPSAVVIHQQRLVFGQGGRIIGSQTGGFDNFERSELADASWQFDLAATVQANIVSMQSQRGLIILTEASEWLADGGTDGGVITPAAFRGEQLSTYGSARAASEMVHSNVVFIQAGGLILNEYLFNFGRQNYEAVDLGELAEHLTQEGLVEIAWAPVPHGLLYVVTQAGSLLTLAYRRTAGNANEGGMLAWTKQTTPDASTVDALTGIQSGTGAIETVCVVPGSNEISNVTVCIRRVLPDGTIIRTVESFDLEYWDYLRSTESGSDALGIGFGLRALVVPDGSVRVNFLVGPTAAVAGLDHLEGMTVAVLLNGMVHPLRVVSDGQVTLDMTDVEEPATAVVGVAPLVEIQPMFATIQLRDGGSDGRAFRVSKLNARFYLSGAAQYSDDNEGAPWFSVDFRAGTDEIDSAVPLKTQLMKLDLAGGYRSETAFIFRNASPLPLNILGVTAELSVHG